MKKLLVFQHVPREHSSRIAEYANEREVTLDIVELWKPYTIPPVSLYDGLVVLGGPMGAYEDYPAKADELRAISEHAGTVPMLGICLGAQLIASALGARVYPHKKDNRHIKEIGHYTVELTLAGRESPLFKGFPEKLTVLQWHGDTFDLPRGAEHLAKAEECAHQAFSYGNAYGVQFHFEITCDLLRTIAESDAKWAHTDFDLNEDELFKTADNTEPIMKKQCYQLLDNFLS